MPVEGWSTSSFEVIEGILQAMRFNLRGREIRNSRDSGAWGWSVAVQSRVRTEEAVCIKLRGRAPNDINYGDRKSVV